jgi:carboxylate-amine ligase
MRSLGHGQAGAMPPEAYDEAYDRPGVPRASYGHVLDALAGQDLDALRERLAAEVAARDVTFGHGADAPVFRLDPVPRVLGAAEWAELEAGLVQRVRALNAFVADAHGERRIVREGVVPARVLDTAEHFEPRLAGAPVPGHGPVVIAGLDLVRDPSGAFLVLEDNVRTPSGLAYAVGAREALGALLDARAAVDPAPAFELLGAALRAAAPAGVDEPCVVVVSDGPDNSAWFEHREIAERLGLGLLRPDDLEVRGGEVRTAVDGRERRVDVVYRRTNEDRLTGDDGELTPLGARLLEPLRNGTVACVNAFGAGVADDKLAHAYVEEMVRFYLGEEPRLRSVPTHDLGDPHVRERLLDRMDEVVVKPRAESGGHGVFVGPHAHGHDREAMAREVEASPERFVAQETVMLSCHPTVVDGGRLEPRHVDLRALVLLAGDRAGALPGGLTRFALEAGSLVVNSSQGGGAKDTWVLRREAQDGRDPDRPGAATPMAARGANRKGS